MNQSPNDTLKPVFILPYSIVALAIRLPASPPFCLPLLTNMMRGLSKTASLCYTELIIILLACMMEQQLLLLVLVPLGDCRRTPCMDWPFDSRNLLCVCVFGIKFVEGSKNKGACFIAFINYMVYCGLCYSRQKIVLLPLYTFLFSLFLLTMLQSRDLTKLLISHLNGLFNYLPCISARNT